MSMSIGWRGSPTSSLAVETPKPAEGRLLAAAMTIVAQAAKPLAFKPLGRPENSASAGRLPTP